MGGRQLLTITFCSLVCVGYANTRAHAGWFGPSSFEEKDLRGRGYTLGSIRGAAGHWTMALRRNDAERYLAERREAGAP